MKLSRERRPPPTSSIVPTRTRTMLRMKASAVIRNSSRSPLARPARGEDVAVEADVVGLGRGEGGEVVRADQRSGAGLERLEVEAVRPPEGAHLLERARRRAGQHPVEIAARPGVAPRVEAVLDHAGDGHRHVVRTDAVQAARQVARQLGPRLEARHLSQRVHPCVGPPSHRQLHRRPQHSRQRRLQLPLHGPQTRLSRPAPEPRPVVFDVQPNLRHRGQYPALRRRRAGTLSNGRILKNAA